MESPFYFPRTGRTFPVSVGITAPLNIQSFYSATGGGGGGLGGEGVPNVWYIK